MQSQPSLLLHAVLAAALLFSPPAHAGKVWRACEYLVNLAGYSLYWPDAKTTFHEGETNFFSPEAVLEALGCPWKSQPEKLPFGGRFLRFPLPRNARLQSLYPGSEAHSLIVTRIGEELVPTGVWFHWPTERRGVELIFNSKPKEDPIPDVESDYKEFLRNEGKFKKFHRTLFQHTVPLPHGGIGAFVAPTDSVFLPTAVEDPGQRYGNNLLRGFLERTRGKLESVLFMGTGAGYDFITASRVTKIERIDAVDVGEAAVATAKINRHLYGNDPRTKVWQSSLFSNVTDKYDAIVFNAPRPISSRLGGFGILPTDINLFDFDAKLLIRFLRDARGHLTRKGRVYLMTDQFFLAALPEELRDTLHVRRVVEPMLWVGDEKDDVDGARQRFAIFEITYR